MTGPSLLRAAVEELYSHPMAEFTARRKALVAGARKAGDRESAAQIAGLRKPTLSADTLNRLVRLAPDGVDELLELGGSLRAAQVALNASELRELSVKRRQLVGDLTRLAFEITDQDAPSASVREEVTATLNAALADEAVAELLTSGALVTQARWDGFGSASPPELAAVLPLDRLRSRRGSTGDRRTTVHPGAAVRESGRTDQTADGPPAEATAARAEQARAARIEAEQAAAARIEAERAEAKSRADIDRRRRLAEAQREATEADGVATIAQETLSAIDRRISELSMQLAHQRQQLATAQRELRDAETRRRTAHLALTRAGGPAQ